MSSRVELVWYGDDAPWYDHGPEHPLRPARVLLTHQLIRDYGIVDGSEVIETPARDAGDDELLLVQRGRELNYSLSDEQFKQITDSIKKSNNITDDAQFQAALKQEGMSIDDLRRNVERQFMISQVQREEVGSKLTITEQEARQYYQLPNQVAVTRAWRPFITPHGGTDICYGLLTGYPCCTTNLHQGWPKFVSSMWMATKDGGLAAVSLGPTVVKATSAPAVRASRLSEA